MKKRKLDAFDKAMIKFAHLLRGIYERLKTYRINPQMIGLDVNMWCHQLKYKFSKYIDPPPKKHKNESEFEYFDRIDPKYGLRYYETAVSMGLDMDPKTAIPHMEESYKREKDRKIWRELILKTAEVEQRNKDQYQKFLIRNEVLKSS